MISTILALQRIKHIRAKLIERNIELDEEFLFDYIPQKIEKLPNCPMAILLGKMNDGIRGLCEIVLIVRDGFPVTIFPRQVNGNFSASALEVDFVLKLKEIM